MHEVDFTSEKELTLLISLEETVVASDDSDSTGLKEGTILEKLIVLKDDKKLSPSSVFSEILDTACFSADVPTLSTEVLIEEEPTALDEVFEIGALEDVTEL